MNTGSPPTSAVPRRRVAALSVAHVLLAFAAVPLPIAVLAVASGRPDGVIEAFSQGGAFMYLVALGAFALTVGYGAAGVFFIRGACIPGALLMLPAALPFLAGLAGMWLGQLRAVQALQTVDPSWKTALMAQALAESMSATQFGATASGVLAVGVAVTAFLGLLAVDRRAAAKDAASAKTGVLVLATALAGVVAVGASAVAVVITRVGPLPIDFAAWTLALLGVALAAASSPTVRHLPAFDEESQGVLWRRAALLPGAMAAAVLFFGYAAQESAKMHAFGAIAAVAPEYKMAVLGQALGEIRARMPLTVLEAALLYLALALPLFCARGAVARGLGSLRFSFGATLAGAGLLLLASLANGPLARDGAKQGPIERAQQAGVELPHGLDADTEPAPGPMVLVTADGRALWDDGSGPAPVPLAAGRFDRPSHQRERGSFEEASALSLAADRRVRFVDLANALAPLAAKGWSEFRILIAAKSKVDRSTPGGLAAIADIFPSAIAVEFRPQVELAFGPGHDRRGELPTDADADPMETPTGRSRSVLDYAGNHEVVGVLSDGDVARLFLIPGSGASVSVPLGPELRGQRKDRLRDLHETFPDLKVLVLAPRGDDDLSTVLQTLDEVRHSDEPWRALKVVLTPDRAALKRAAEPGRSPGDR